MYLNENVDLRGLLIINIQLYKVYISLKSHNSQEMALYKIPVCISYDVGDLPQSKLI